MGSPLCKEMLTLEPMTMVRPPPPSHLPPLALSNLDHMLNFYNSALLFYNPTSPHLGISSSHHHIINGGIIATTNPHPNMPLGKSFCHGTSGDTMDIAAFLRCALQKLLTHYPAAAGRLRVNHHQRRLEVECNGEGVQFVSAHANISLSDLGDVSLAHPSIDLLFPTIQFHQEERPPIVAMQVTRFKCGGFTLSINSNHAYLDGHSVAVFLHNFASIARGDGLSIAPDIVSRRERMKPQSPPMPTFKHPLILKKGDDNFTNLTLSPQERYGNVTRVSLCASTLERLRRDVLFGHNCFNACSRYQALIALLWKARARSLVQSQAPPKHIEMPIRIPINLRGKIMPTLTQGYVGNGICPTIVTASLQELCESPLHILVHKIQKAIFSVTPEFVQSTLDYLDSGEGPLESYPNPCFFGMTSLVGLPFYDTNFGWGYPVYCGVPSWQMNNRLYILDGDRQGGGWNVVVVLESSREHNLFLETLATYVTFST